MLFEDTKRNITNLLNDKEHDAEWIRFSYQMDRSYEPLRLLYYEKAPNYPFLEMLTLTYQRYAIFIDDLFDTLPKDMLKTCAFIQSTVEWALKSLCGTSKLFCQVGMLEIRDSDEYWQDKMRMYDQIKEESQQRLENRDS